jgi:hypothetical protein
MGTEVLFAAAASGTAPNAATNERREIPDPYMAGKISQNEEFSIRTFPVTLVSCNIY